MVVDYGASTMEQYCWNHIDTVENIGTSVAGVEGNYINPMCPMHLCGSNKYCWNHIGMMI